MDFRERGDGTKDAADYDPARRGGWRIFALPAKREATIECVRAGSAAKES
jgi:hypothetical protein